MRVSEALQGQARLDDDEATKPASSGTDCPEVRDAETLLNTGQDLAVPQALEVSEATCRRWRNQYGGMKSEEARRLKGLEDENRRPKQIVADQALDIQMLKHVGSKNCRTSRPAMERRPLRTGVPRPGSFQRSSRSPSEGRVRRWISRGARSGTKPGRKRTRRR